MRVLITGATGLIGCEVGKLLAQRGHEIHIVTRQTANLNLPYPCRAFHWDGYQALLPRESLEGVEALVHLAAESIAEGRWTPEKKKRIRDSRVVGTQNIVKSVNGTSVKTVVCGSAMGIYGDCGEAWLKETNPPGEDFLARVCVEWEDALSGLDPGKVRTAILRTSLVLARNQGTLGKMIPLFSKGLGGSLGNGQQYMSWIHLEDIAGLFVAAVENDSYRGAYNAAAPEPVQNKEFTSALAKVLNKPALFPAPKLALKLALGEMSEAVLASQRLSCEKILKVGYQFRFPRLQEALMDLCGRLAQGGHELVFEQWVAKNRDEIFQFFSDENNLEVITPSFLNFRVLGKSTAQMEKGTLINYQLKLYGTPLRWQSRIEDWQPGQRFVDVQVKGPYRSWHHTHEFFSLGSGTLIRDRVLFQLPLGPFGEVVAGRKVLGDVKQIFDYRKKKIGELFA